MEKIVTPYNSKKTKKEQVKNMFNKIAFSYDFLNHSLSLGMDYYWRKKAIQLLPNPKKILDIATGTGDFAITASKYTNASIIGIDIAKNMLDIAKVKIQKKNLEKRIKLKLADSEKMPFENKEFDAITVGFGVRNFQNLEKSLLAMYEVLKVGGMIVVLEPTKPKKFPIKQLYNVYFNYILPFVGGVISKDKHAYSYLVDSVDSFASGNDFCKKLQKIGFQKCRYTSLTFGVVTLYTAIK